MNVTKEKKNYIIILDIVFVIMIAVMTLWNLSACDRIKIIDDEFGYWGIAAIVTGFDWSDLMAVTEYYSFGYSVVLIPLLLLHKIGIAMPVIYKLALIMNACFMVFVYWLIRYVSQKLFPDFPTSFMQAVCLFITLYIGNSFRNHSAWSETYLLFMFWCVIAFFVRFIENPNYCNIFLLIFTSVNAFAIHMRALGVLIAVLIVLTLYFAQNWKMVDKKYVIATIVFTIGLLGLFFVAKEYVTNFLYSNRGNTSMNDIPAQIERTKSILSVTGMIDYAMSILGKLFYSGAATFLFVLIGFAYAVFRVFITFGSLVAKKPIQNSTKQWYTFFVLLSFLGELGISCIFKCIKFFSGDITKVVHLDSVVYGRYLDFAIGPMILFGAIAIYEIKDHYKEVVLAGLLFLFTMFAAQYQIDILTYYNEDAMGFRQNASPWFSLLYHGNLNYFMYYVAGISAFVFLLILFIGMLGKKRKCGITIAFILVGIFSGICGLTSSKEFIQSKSSKDKTVETVREIIEVTDATVPVYMVVREDGNVTSDTKILQWTLGERGIHTLLYTELQNMDVDQAIFLTDSSDVRIRGVLSDNADYLYDSGTIAVFAGEGNTYYTDLLEKSKQMAKVASPLVRKINLAEVVTDLSYVKANGSLYYNYQAQGGYLTGGMGVALDDGVYEFMVDIRIRDVIAGSDVGYITVGDTTGNVQDTIVLHADDFIDKERQIISAQVKVEDEKEPFVGVYTYGEAAYRIYDISYRKMIGNKEMSCEEMAEIEKCLWKKQSGDKVYYVDSNNSAITGFPIYRDCDMSYLPGDIVMYKQFCDSDFYIVEKTDQQVIEIMNDKLTQICETKNYVAFR